LFWYISTPTATQTDVFSTIKPEYSNHAIAAGLASGLLTQQGADLIREFIAEKRAAVGICIGVGSTCFLLPWSAGAGSSDPTGNLP
jgi:hypothetical protein